MAPWFGVRALGGFTTLLACCQRGADLRRSRALTGYRTIC